MQKKYTIKDIAELAGVSKGTVDRVIHKRGKVSEDALLKINKILDEIDYHPNPIAKNLKNNKIYRLCILFPESEKDLFWTPCYAAVTEIEKKFQAFGIKIETYGYDPESPASFTEVAENLIMTKPDALLMAPLFFNEAQKILKLCIEHKISISTFNNIIEKNSVTNYIGQDLYQSGRIAAKLLDSLLGSGNILIAHIDEAVQNATHMQEKEKGFKDYFEADKNKNYHVTTLSLYIHKNPKLNYNEKLEHYLNENPNIDGIFVTTSKTYVAARINQKRNLKIVGYDLIAKNIEHLKNGSIDFLINQNPKKQAYLGLENLAEHLLFGKEIPKQTLLPIDIINSENYLQYLE